MDKIKHRVFAIVEASEKDDVASYVFDCSILGLIALNVLAIILESMPSLPDSWDTYFRIFETVSVVIFTAEYAARLWSCTVSARYSGSILGRLRFVFSFMAALDLLAISPFYLPMLLPLDLRFLRILRLVRLVRLAKLARYSQSLRLLGTVFYRKRNDLLASLFIGCLVLLLASSLMYAVEHDAQPDAFSSIPVALWWGVCSLTTVGYGDVVPVTPFGKLCASIISLVSIGVFALPTAILGSAFVQELDAREKKDVTCPHCGKTIVR